MGMRMPETCWAVCKWQVINLMICCIWLVDSVEKTDLSFRITHENMGGCTGIAPAIPYSCRRWQPVVSFILRSVYSQGRNPPNPLTGGSVGPRAGLEVVHKTRHISPAGSLTSESPSPQPSHYIYWSILALYSVRYHWLLIIVTMLRAAYSKQFTVTKHQRTITE